MTSTLDAPRKLSKLEAVNTVLAAYGNDPVAALGSSVMANKAEQHLIRALVDLNLKPRMNFSTTLEEAWSPDINGEIAVSPDVVRVKPTGSYLGKDYIQRGTKLFDRENNTYVFSGDLTVHVTRSLGFEELPWAASWYTAMAACVSFLVEHKPADPALQSYRGALATALTYLEQEDAELGRANLIDNSPHFARARGRARGRRSSI